ncbi:hypothetical protein DYB30_002581 [Aphanomyces astaci]|uniref:SET domain-containing protein n=2 Tax=Aphanomyces astaci TaxID=112090 RepID=A0A397FCB8_APHAT|nr:hypothetical protein DYB30_002581 [Aphanomyces astaci]RHZ26469.1 hypothetical protein DYB31_001177 [Aphanomyces astaci]
MAEEFLLTAEKSIDLAFKTRTCLPGDDITQHITNVTQKLRLGAGLVATTDNRVVCTNAGVLRYRPPNRSFATLGMLAFDGASKRNRPNMQPGSLVYCRVVRAAKDLDACVTCEGTSVEWSTGQSLTLPTVAPTHLAKKDWMTGLAIYGELTGGYVFKASIGLAKSLVQDECAVLESLGRAIPFELAVGVNGVVWLNSKSSQDTILVANAILNSEGLTPAQRDRESVEDSNGGGVEVKMSRLPNAGLGLFATTTFNAGDVVCVYRGQVLATADALKVADKSYLMRLGGGVYIDARTCIGVKARYINDCRSRGVHNVEFEKLPLLQKANVRATRYIHIGDEIYVDYGKWYWLAYNLSHPHDLIK